MKKIITIDKIQKEYAKLISTENIHEEKLHQFFIKYPIFLPIWYPYGNIVFSKLKLANQHIVDFAFAREDTPGVKWHLIEIEKPSHKQFTKKGDPSKELTHGLRQILDWDNWFKVNRTQVEKYFPFHNEVSQIRLAMDNELKLVIGRRNNAKNNPLIESFSTGSRVDIMSYDRLLNNLTHPALDNLEQPIKVCNFVNGKIKVISELKINYSYTIELKSNGR